MQNSNSKDGAEVPQSTEVDVTTSSQTIAKPLVGGSFFDVELLEKRMNDLKNLPPFKPEKFEPRYSVTQLFETGVEVTLHFVIRNGNQIWYNSEQSFV